MSTAEIDVTLKTLAYGGDAVGRMDDGRAVFVPFGLPGERVRIRLVQEKERFARGTLTQVLEAAPGRVQPRCGHFGVCGGCHYQHLDYQQQLEAKADILRDQLVRIGHLDHPPVDAAIGSTAPWNYRNQLQFHLTPEGRLGFVGALGPKARDGIFPVEECHLPDTDIGALWPQLSFEPSPAIERVVVRSGVDGELMLVLESASPSVPELEVEATVSIAHVYADDVVIQAGEDHIRLVVMERVFRVSPTSFFQVNIPVAEKMIRHMLDLLPASVGMVIDAYCGVGLFSAFLASRCARLIGIEASPRACEDYASNLDEFENVELYEDAVENVLPALDVTPEAVVVDPPRGGLERGALDGLVNMRPGMVVYVSCDAATLARDARRLVEGGYRLERVTPFDMFPQTYHIESISLFRK